jgi:hypothetical protein
MAFINRLMPSLTDVIGLTWFLCWTVEVGKLMSSV